MCIVISVFVATIVGAIVATNEVRQFAASKELKARAIDEFVSTTTILLDTLSYQTASILANSYSAQTDNIAVSVTDYYGFTVFNSFKDDTLANRGPDTVLYTYHHPPIRSHSQKTSTITILYVEPSLSRIILDILRKAMGFFVVIWISTNLALIYYINRFVLSPITDLHASIRQSLIEKKPVASDLPDSTILGNLASAYYGLLNEILRYRNEQERTDKLNFLGILSASVAHDFNNLLSIITVNSESMIMSGKYKDERLNNIHEAALDGAHIVAKLLKNFNSNKSEAISDFSSRDLIDRTLENSRSFLGTKAITLSGSTDYTCTIRGTKAELLGSIVNIVKNSIEALDSGKGSIDISCRRPSPDELRQHNLANGQYCLIQIQDNGPGIETAQLDSLFEPFISTKEVGKGVGLGLWSASEYVKSIGGRLIYNPATPTGANFKLFIPAHQSQTEPGLLRLSHQDEADLEGASILIVEDQAAILSVYTTYFESLGVQVYGTRTIERAARLLASYPMDVVFSDLHLPDGSGLQFIKESKRRFPGIYYVLSSGNRDGLDRKVDIADLFLPKPVGLKTLSSAIASGIRTRSLDRESGSVLANSSEPHA